MLDSLEILYRDDHYVVVNKPSGILVHPFKAESNDRITLMSLLRDQLGQLVYPIHRLDRPVSGPVVFSLSSEGVKKLQDIWHSDKVVKKYQALVKGEFLSPGQFDFDLRNDNKVPQKALTKYFPIKNFYIEELESHFTLVDIYIHTGRRHQIRRHFSRRCSNLIGDTKYGRGKLNRFFRDNFALERIFLHCVELSIENLFTKTPIKIEQPLPSNLSAVISQLENR